MFNKNLMKRALVLTAIGCLPSFAVLAQSPYEHRQQQMQQGSNNYGQNQSRSSTYNQNNTLDSEEQQFAAQLSDLHRQVFTQQFNSLQRAEAMALVEAEQGKKYGRKMTPDMAVEQVMKSHRGVETGQGQQMPQSQGSTYDTQRSSKYSGSSRNYQSPYSDTQNQQKTQKGYNYQYDDDSNMNQDQNSNYNNQNNYNNSYQNDSNQDDSTQNDSSTTKKKWWQKSKKDSQDSSSQNSNRGYWD